MSQFIEHAGDLLGLKVVPHDEVTEFEGSVRPDFGVRVEGVIVGHIEMKAPGTSLDPSSYGPSTHNYKQWQRLKELPNLLHTNGTEFRLWRFGELVDDPVNVHTTDLERHTGKLTAPGRLRTVRQRVPAVDPGSHLFGRQTCRHSRSAGSVCSAKRSMTPFVPNVVP